MAFPALQKIFSPFQKFFIAFGIYWDYNVFVRGGMAQLVERRVRNAKARGSNPLISTKIGEVRKNFADFTFSLFTLHFSLFIADFGGSNR